MEIKQPIGGTMPVGAKAAEERGPSPAPSTAAPAAGMTFEPWGTARWVLGGLLLAAFTFTYWPILLELVNTWDREPDYSHGFFVVPIALFFLWRRRDLRPKQAVSAPVSGLVLIGLACGLLMYGSLTFRESLCGWSIPLWVAGAALVLGGWPMLGWSWPAVLFLFFMVPLPYALETGFSLPLQKTAARMSAWVLQLLGQPAIHEGTTIFLKDTPLEVERACSGLRMFMGIAALAMVYLVLVKRPMWQRVALVLSLAPIALAANTLRIVATGLLYQYASGEAARHFSHDLAGYVMIPVAAAMFGLVLWYLDKLTIELETVDRSTLLGKERGAVA